MNIWYTIILKKKKNSQKHTEPLWTAGNSRNTYIHKFTCLKQDQRLLIDISISLLSNFVVGHLFFFFFYQPPQKMKNRIAPSAASKPQYLPVQFFSPFIVLAKGRKVINSAKCQVCDIVILSEWWAPKSLSDLSSPPPAPCCLFLFFLFFFSTRL